MIKYLVVRVDLPEDYSGDVSESFRYLADMETDNIVWSPEGEWDSLAEIGESLFDIEADDFDYGDVYLWPEGLLDEISESFHFGIDTLAEANDPVALLVNAGFPKGQLIARLEA